MKRISAADGACPFSDIFAIGGGGGGRQGEREVDVPGKEEEEEEKSQCPRHSMVEADRDPSKCPYAKYLANVVFVQYLFGCFSSSLVRGSAS